MLDLVAVAIHIPAGLAATAAGLLAMFSTKGGWWHRRGGLVYLVSIGVLAATAVGLVATRGPQFTHLLMLGAAAFGLALFGYLQRRRRQKWHILGMGGSYVVMLTAFYVDNGPKLPLWQLLPDIAFWVLPSLIGLPLIARAIARRGWRCIG